MLEEKNSQTLLTNNVRWAQIYNSSHLAHPSGLQIQKYIITYNFSTLKIHIHISAMWGMVAHWLR